MAIQQLALTAAPWPQFLLPPLSPTRHTLMESWRHLQPRPPPRRLGVRGVLLALMVIAAPTAAAAGNLSRTEKKAYNYIIAVGCFALVAVYIPLTAVLTSRRARNTFQILALLAALASSVASFVGAVLGGTLWQTLPTGVFMLFLAALVGVRFAGGWHVVRQRARAPNRIRLSILEDRHWRADVSKDEYARLVANAGVTREMVILGAESDQDAVAIGLIRKGLWKSLSDQSGGARLDAGAGSNGAGRTGGAPNANPPGQAGLTQDAAHTQIGALNGDSDKSYASGASRGTLRLAGRSVPFIDRHEPNGLLLIGAIKHAGIWMNPLLDALRASIPKARQLVLAHDVAMAMWWAGMALGALAKTGFTGEMGEFSGSTGLRDGGIWLQTVLLLLAIFTLPYTRAVSRYGVRVVKRLMVAFSQGVLSLGLGIAMIIAAREKDIDGNLVAYAGGLLLAASAATIWSFLAMHTHLSVLQRLVTEGSGMRRSVPKGGGLRGDVEGGRAVAGRSSDAPAPLSLQQKRTAYLAALATRPRHGYTTGQNPIISWGEAGPGGRAPLEVIVEYDEDVSTEDPDPATHDAEAGHEWAILEGAARKKRFTH